MNVTRDVNAPRRPFDGKELRALRTAGAHTVTEVAGAVGVRDRTIERWERGQMTPQGEMLSRVERLVHVLSVEAAEGLSIPPPNHLAN